MTAKYDAARDAFGDGRLSWKRDRIVAQLVSSEYVYSPAHKDRRDLKGTVGAPVVVEGRDLSRGWAKAANIVFRQVSGPDVVGVVFRRDGGEEKDTTLIVYHDAIDNFPMKTNGGDIHINVPDTGVFRI